ncbi:MAG TPA: kelch repeat-containing protein, partial [Tepidisphaeraceae bacterium]|nr:kelch repeat-containing protein [Tepidisphaeraceae bacterium]
MTGSAGNGTDVQSLSGTITIPAGASFADLPIVAIDDTLAESEELLTLTLVPAEAYSSTLINSASVRIIDNDSPTSFNNIVWTKTVTPPVSYAEWQSIEHNGSVYLFGGFTGTFRPVDDTWRFDPATHSFTQLAPMPNRLPHAQPASVGNKIYLVGGY